VKLDIELKPGLKQRNRLIHIPLPTLSHSHAWISRLRRGDMVRRLLQ